jgi:hypothetical protein
MTVSQSTSDNENKLSHGLTLLRTFEDKKSPFFLCNCLCIIIGKSVYLCGRGVLNKNSPKWIFMRNSGLRAGRRPAQKKGGADSTINLRPTTLSSELVFWSGNLSVLICRGFGCVPLTFCIYYNTKEETCQVFFEKFFNFFLWDCALVSENICSRKKSRWGWVAKTLVSIKRALTTSMEIRNS